MAETQEDLKIGIGTEEAGEKLKPQMVKIIDVIVEEVGQNNAKKMICMVKHPDKEELIKISSIKYERKNKLDTVGLWVNKDSQGLLRKDSALAYLMNMLQAKTPVELREKQIMTAEGKEGYLAFKGY